MKPDSKPGTALYDGLELSAQLLSHEQGRARVLVLLTDGQDVSSQASLSVALRNDPRQPRALYEMGRLRASRGDKAGAGESFRALQAADPQFARAHGVAEQLARLK